MTKCGKCGTKLECLGGCSAHHDNWYCPKCPRPSENEMTTTKEDQIRAEFEESLKNSNYILLRYQISGFYTEDGLEERWRGYKACAESYENKLAEAYALFDGIKNILHDTQKQLSEANARNAMLYNTLKDLCDTDFQDRDWITARDVITANSEAVAAWEAENPDNVALASELWATAQAPTSTIGIEGVINLMLPAIEAYEREVQAKVWDEAEKMCESIGDEYTEREGRKYPELRSDATTGAYSCMAAARTEADNLRAANKGQASGICRPYGEQFRHLVINREIKLAELNKV